jgi:Protein of unknown function (DUF2934)
MVTKRESPGNGSSPGKRTISPGGKTTKRKPAASAAELTDSGVFMVLESTHSETLASASIDPDVRRRLVAAEAYFLAERRGFAAGNELEDWVTAEAAVDSRLQPSRVA